MKKLFNAFLTILLIPSLCFAAINAGTLWEFRPANGAADNGGGFADLDPGTSVDYGNQNSPELVINDGATAGIGNTTLTSAGGGFTAAMAGNIIYLQTGTNLVDGWYQITVFTDTNTVTLDRAPDDGVGGVSGADGNVGGALDIFTDAFLDNTTLIVPGQTIYVKNDGTMTLTGHISLVNDGTTALPINIIGYNATRGDNPTVNDRPLMAAGANNSNFDDYWLIKNFRFTATSQSGLRVDIGGIIHNCHANNSSGISNRSAIVQVAGEVILCEAQSVNGYAIGLNGDAVVVKNCYLHDSAIGVWNNGRDNCQFIANIISDCAVGISDAGVSGAHSILITQNTFYNGTTGLSINDGFSFVVTDNIFHTFTNGAAWTTEQLSNFFDNNCWYNASVSNVTKGDHAVNADPLLTDPANDDFTLQGGSPCLGAGMQIGVPQGVVGDYKWNIGADQDDNAAAGGGIRRHPGMGGGFGG